MVVLLINLTLGFIVPMIDNSAHIGGLIGGFLASAFLHLPKHKFRELNSIFLWFNSCRLRNTANLWIWYFSGNKTTQLVNVQIAQELLELGEIERAYPLLKKQLIVIWT
ncbi:hypothetical protein KHA80_03335 [Anaerobacillus sp. HL2]|nr:hypothetical protein KHA80_03335 [Anaerobacillus sp. HL2]